MFFFAQRSCYVWLRLPSRLQASSKADNKGHFSLEPFAKLKLFYLRVSKPGMDAYQLRVRIGKRAGQELNIHLSVAT